VVVLHGQEVGLARFEPALRGTALALRAMPVAAGNGDLPITCLMESNFLWGVGRQKGMLRGVNPSGETKS
jgi:hypothetical protein